jgi:hypothetical protein
MGDRDLRVRLKNPGARNEYLEVLNSHLRNEGLQVLIRRFLYLGSQASDFGDLQLGTRKTQIVTSEFFQISIRRAF